MTSLLVDSSGKGINIPAPIFLTDANWTPSRQLIRAYLRQVAISHINRYYGLEDRKIRRSLALSLAKNSNFKQQVRDSTKAW